MYPGSRECAERDTGRRPRFFGGLSLEETAEALHVSIDTVKRDWRFAKLWLLRELSGD